MVKNVEVIALRNYLRGLVDNLRAYSSLEPEEDITQTDRVVYNSNTRMIRAGCIIRTKFDGEYRFLLGRLEKRVAYKEPSYRLKSAGGYLKLREDSPGGVDLSSFAGLVRELNEESFYGIYDLRKRTISPLGVIDSPEKGILQFFSADLRNYPKMGKRSDATFKKFKDYDIKVRWCNLEEVIQFAFGGGGDNGTVPKETAWMIASSCVFSKSVNVVFTQDSAGKYGAESTGLRVPSDAVSMIKSRTGLSWFPDAALGYCRVHYSVPVITEMDPEIARIVPSFNIFFSVGPFMHQMSLHNDELSDLITRRATRSTPDRLVRRFVRRNYEKILYEDMMTKYLVDKNK